MECPHLTSETHIVKSVKKEAAFLEWMCSACQDSKSPWICVHCGIINCGRYVNGHAKAHFEENNDHMVCMDCENYASYCYICDDFVINDMKELNSLRERLQMKNELEANNKPLKKHHNVLNEEGENKRSKRHKKSIGKKSYCKARVSGLRNLGNTCFMNAVLQSLSNIQQFSCYFKQLPALEHKNHKNGKKNNHIKSTSNGDEVLLAEELRKTLISLRQGSKGAISPESLFAVIWKVVPRFRGYQQQDAHEFLRYMLDRLHMELLNILPYSSSVMGAKNKATIVTTIFGGILQNEVTCLVCGTDSKKHDPFLDLSLDIPQHFIVKPPPPSNKTKEEELPSVQLLDCLTSFTELEELAESELYLCHSCKCKQKSTKRFWIRRLPNVLCLHLKRFRWNNYFRTKLDNYVDFPIQGLDMNKFILVNRHETRGTSSGSTLYDLAAVIVHHGSGAGSGHYTAYATHDGCWHHFNDSSVTITDERTVASCKAYILFYIRRELNLTPFSV